MEIRQTQAESNRTGVWPTELNANASASNSSYPSLYASGVSNSSGLTGPTGPMSMHDGFDNVYELPLHSIGSDTSPDNSHREGSGSRSQSNHPTPSTLSHHTSSGTSYTSPPNYATGTHISNGAPQQQSSGFVVPGDSTWKAMNPSNPLDEMSSGQAQNLAFGVTGMTPGMTGMTPIPDSMWPPAGTGEGSDWIYGWPESTPQPQ